jgi:hypothetical protein
MCLILNKPSYYVYTIFFQKSSSHLKILGARNVTWSKFHTDDPQILGATVQNLVVRATWRPGFVLLASDGL